MRRCSIITGPIHSGKTTLLKRMIADFRAGEVSVGGILAEALYDERGKKTGFDAEDIATGRRIPLVREFQQPLLPGDQRVGRFTVLGRGLNSASEVLLEAAGLIAPAQPEDLSMPAPAAVLCLDEVGPLEMEGKGYYPVLRRILDSYAGELVLVGRTEIYDDLAGLLYSAGWLIRKNSPPER